MKVHLLGTFIKGFWGRKRNKPKSVSKSNVCNLKRVGPFPTTVTSLAKTLHADPPFRTRFRLSDSTRDDFESSPTDLASFVTHYGIEKSLVNNANAYSSVINATFKIFIANLFWIMLWRGCHDSRIHQLQNYISYCIVRGVPNEMTILPFHDIICGVRK